MRCETTSPSVQECALCASSVYHAHHANVCENVVIGVLVVLCELHEIVRVHVIPLCGAVVGPTLGLIAHVVVVVFVVAILHRIFCIWRYSLYISCDSVGTFRWHITEMNQAPTSCLVDFLTEW